MNLPEDKDRTRGMTMNITKTIRRYVLGPSSRTVPLSADEADREYRAEAASWDLPAGKDWAERPFPDVAFDGHAVHYGRGAGRDQAQRHWMMAWYHALSEATSELDRNAALQQLAKVSSVWHRPDVQAARRGDLAGLRRFLEANRLERL
jgi:hypothetical protein